jgi:hypothetical protein
VILAPSPIRVDLPKLATTAALLNVEMVTLIIGVYGTATPIAPEDGQTGSFQVGSKWHSGFPVSITDHRPLMR